MSNLSFSGKLGEKNKRPLGDVIYPTRDEVKKRISGTPTEDDDGSIDLRPTRSNPACGACRTRESKAWWKAPKGLATNILCDNCGLNWRKYADLNVRPVRDESLASGKTKAIEKREGTPLGGPTAKRAKVTQTTISHDTCSYRLFGTDIFNIFAINSPSCVECAAVALSSLSQEWTAWQSFAVSAVPIPDSCWYVIIQN